MKHDGPLLKRSAFLSLTPAFAFRIAIRIGTDARLMCSLSEASSNSDLFNLVERCIVMAHIGEEHAMLGPSPVKKAAQHRLCKFQRRQNDLAIQTTLPKSGLALFATSSMLLMHVVACIAADT